MEDGAPREPVGGGAKRGRPLLGARGARRDVLFERGAVPRLRPGRVRHAEAAPGRHRAGSGRGHQGREHELPRIHRRSCTRVNGRSVTARSDDLVQRAGESDARIVGDGSLQERGGGGGYGDRHPAGRPLAVLPIVESDVPRVVHEVQRPGRPRPGAVHVVRYLNLPGDVVLREPPDQQIPARDRVGECDGGGQHPIPGRECPPLDEGRGGRLTGGRAGKESCEGSDHDRASSAEGRRRTFHGNSLPDKSENGERRELASVPRDAMPRQIAIAAPGIHHLFPDACLTPPAHGTPVEARRPHRPAKPPSAPAGNALAAASSRYPGRARK